MKKVITLIILILSVVLYNNSTAQETAITKSIFSNGIVNSSTTEYKLTGTIGQSFIGYQKSNSNQNEIGFWNSFNRIPTQISEFELNSSENQQDRFLIYPNPFNSVLHIEAKFPLEEKIKIYLINSLGKSIEIFSGIYPTNKLTFNSSGLTNGFYYIHIQSKSYSLTKKLSLIN